MVKQRTIKRPVNAIGIGIHTGKKIRMTLRPAGADTGVTFVRGNTRIGAHVDNVCDTLLATSVGCDGLRVSTVEHLLSALWGVAIDNLVVELSGPEVPALDGSAAPFIYLIRQAGIVEQDAPKQFIRIKRPLHVENGDATLTLEPFDGFKASYTLVYDHPVYNRYPKRVEVDFSRQSYTNDVSRARSFGLVSDLEQAQAIDRCKGSSLENSVGIDDFTILNEEGLRYEDEFVKHKLLDLIGDLYLLGHPILGEVRGYMSGHSLNNQLSRALLAARRCWELTTDDTPVQHADEPTWSLDWTPAREAGKA